VRSLKCEWLVGRAWWGGGEGVLGEGGGRGEVGETGRLGFRGRGGRRGSGRSGRWAGGGEADPFRDAARLVWVGRDGIGVVQWGRSYVMAGIHGRTRAIRRRRCEGRRRCGCPGPLLGKTAWESGNRWCCRKDGPRGLSLGNMLLRQKVIWAGEVDWKD
jgi:hypothetical protein